MDVSRIGAVSPKQVDWRKLTAKEIIKYDNEGVNVPIEYLQWAREFINDVSSSDNDETTYEAATSAVNKESSADNLDEQNSQSTEATDEDENSTSDEDLTPAQAKRQNLIENGVSLRGQAKTFTKDSKSSSTQNVLARALISKTESDSNSEIQALDNYMKQILSKAEATQNELKSEVDKINSSKNDRSAFGKINRLQEQLTRYGQEGQANIAKSEGKFDDFGISLDDKSSVIFTAADTGTETVGIGLELLDSVPNIPFLRDYIYGIRAIKAGNKAISNSEKTQEAQTSAISTNSTNIGSVQNYKSQVESKTGVASIDIESGKNKAGDDEASQKSKSENNTTESDMSASANIDKILQAKIRKGEDVGA